MPRTAGSLARLLDLAELQDEEDDCWYDAGTAEGFRPSGDTAPVQETARLHGPKATTDTAGRPLATAQVQGLGFHADSAIIRHTAALSGKAGANGSVPADWQANFSVYQQQIQAGSYKVGPNLSELVAKQQARGIHESYGREHLQRLCQYEAHGLYVGRRQRDYCRKVHPPGCTICVTCHFCRQKTVEPKSVCGCSGSGQANRGAWCGKCLWVRMGENLTEVLKDHRWRCPACRDICNCSGPSCVRLRKGMEPTDQLHSEAQALHYRSVAHYLILALYDKNTLAEQMGAAPAALVRSWKLHNGQVRQLMAPGDAAAIKRQQRQRATERELSQQVSLIRQELRIDSAFWNLDEFLGATGLGLGILDDDDGLDDDVSATSARSLSHGRPASAGQVQPQAGGGIVPAAGFGQLGAQQVSGSNALQPGMQHVQAISTSHAVPQQRMSTAGGLQPAVLGRQPVHGITGMLNTDKGSCQFGSLGALAEAVLINRGPAQHTAGLQHAVTTDLAARQAHRLNPVEPSASRARPAIEPAVPSSGGQVANRQPLVTCQPAMVAGPALSSDKLVYHAPATEAGKPGAASNSVPATPQQLLVQRFATSMGTLVRPSCSGTVGSTTHSQSQWVRLDACLHDTEMSGESAAQTTGTRQASGRKRARCPSWLENSFWGSNSTKRRRPASGDSRIAKAGVPGYASIHHAASREASPALPGTAGDDVAQPAQGPGPHARPANQVPGMHGDTAAVEDIQEDAGRPSQVPVAPDEPLLPGEGQGLFSGMLGTLRQALRALEAEQQQYVQQAAAAPMDMTALLDPHWQHARLLARALLSGIPHALEEHAVLCGKPFTEGAFKTSELQCIRSHEELRSAGLLLLQIALLLSSEAGAVESCWRTVMCRECFVDFRRSDPRARAILFCAELDMLMFLHSQGMDVREPCSVVLQRVLSLAKEYADLQQLNLHTDIDLSSAFEFGCLKWEAAQAGDPEVVEQRVAVFGALGNSDLELMLGMMAHLQGRSKELGAASLHLLQPELVQLLKPEVPLPSRIKTNVLAIIHAIITASRPLPAPGQVLTESQETQLANLSQVLLQVRLPGELEALLALDYSGRAARVRTAPAVDGVLQAVRQGLGQASETSGEGSAVYGRAGAEHVAATLGLVYSVLHQSHDMSASAIQGSIIEPAKDLQRFFTSSITVHQDRQTAAAAYPPADGAAGNAGGVNWRQRQLAQFLSRQVLHCLTQGGMHKLDSLGRWCVELWLYSCLDFSRRQTLAYLTQALAAHPEYARLFLGCGVSQQDIVHDSTGEVRASLTKVVVIRNVEQPASLANLEQVFLARCTELDNMHNPEQRLRGQRAAMTCVLAAAFACINTPSAQQEDLPVLLSLSTYMCKTFQAVYRLALKEDEGSEPAEANSADPQLEVPLAFADALPLSCVPLLPALLALLAVAPSRATYMKSQRALDGKDAKTRKCVLAILAMLVELPAPKGPVSEAARVCLWRLAATALTHGPQPPTHLLNSPDAAAAPAAAAAPGNGTDAERPAPASAATAAQAAFPVAMQQQVALYSAIINGTAAAALVSERLPQMSHWVIMGGVRRYIARAALGSCVWHNAALQAVALLQSLLLDGALLDAEDGFGRYLPPLMVCTFDAVRGHNLPLQHACYGLWMQLLPKLSDAGLMLKPDDAMKMDNQPKDGNNTLATGKPCGRGALAHAVSNTLRVLCCVMLDSVVRTLSGTHLQAAVTQRWQSKARAANSLTPLDAQGCRKALVKALDAESMLTLQALAQLQTQCITALLGMPGQLDMQELQEARAELRLADAAAVADIPADAVFLLAERGTAFLKQLAESGDAGWSWALCTARYLAVTKMVAQEHGEGCLSSVIQKPLEEMLKILASGQRHKRLTTAAAHTSQAQTDEPLRPQPQGAGRQQAAALQECIQLAQQPVPVRVASTRPDNQALAHLHPPPPLPLLAQAAPAANVVYAANLPSTSLATTTVHVAPLGDPENAVVMQGSSHVAAALHAITPAGLPAHSAAAQQCGTQPGIHAAPANAPSGPLPVPPNMGILYPPTQQSGAKATLQDSGHNRVPARNQTPTELKWPYHAPLHMLAPPSHPHNTAQSPAPLLPHTNRIGAQGAGPLAFQNSHNSVMESAPDTVLYGAIDASPYPSQASNQQLRLRTVQHAVGARLPPSVQPQVRGQQAAAARLAVANTAQPAGQVQPAAAQPLVPVQPAVPATQPARRGSQSTLPYPGLQAFTCPQQRSIQQDTPSQQPVAGTQSASAQLPAQERAALEGGGYVLPSHAQHSTYRDTQQWVLSQAEAPDTCTLHHQGAEQIANPPAASQRTEARPSPSPAGIAASQGAISNSYSVAGAVMSCVVKQLKGKETIIIQLADTLCPDQQVKVIIVGQTTTRYSSLLHQQSERPGEHVCLTSLRLPDGKQSDTQPKIFITTEDTVISQLQGEHALIPQVQSSTQQQISNSTASAQAAKAAAISLDHVSAPCKRALGASALLRAAPMAADPAAAARSDTEVLVKVPSTLRPPCTSRAELASGAAAMRAGAQAACEHRTTGASIPTAMCVHLVPPFLARSLPMSTVAVNSQAGPVATPNVLATPPDVMASRIPAPMSDHADLAYTNQTGAEGQGAYMIPDVGAQAEPWPSWPTCGTATQQAATLQASQQHVAHGMQAAGKVNNPSRSFMGAWLAPETLDHDLDDCHQVPETQVQEFINTDHG